jgi:hypothetical protein
VSDIVARLAVHAVTGDGWTRADCAEAAAEIERLRGELTLYRAENGCTRGQRTTQWCGEATRLREALERAADTLSDASLLDAWADARAALKETGHE